MSNESLATLIWVVYTGTMLAPDMPRAGRQVCGLLGLAMMLVNVIYQVFKAVQ